MNSIMLACEYNFDVVVNGVSFLDVSFPIHNLIYCVFVCVCFFQRFFPQRGMGDLVSTRLRFRTYITHIVIFSLDGCYSFSTTFTCASVSGYAAMVLAEI